MQILYYLLMLGFGPVTTWGLFSASHARAEDRQPLLFAEGVYQATVIRGSAKWLRFRHPDQEALEIVILSDLPSPSIRLVRMGVIEWQYRSQSCALDVVASSDRAGAPHTEAFIIQDGLCPEWNETGLENILSGSYTWIAE